MATTLLGALPTPSREYVVWREEADTSSSSTSGGGPHRPPRAPRAIPPYGSRQNYVPRGLSDFGDGGAFPEVHVAQYPLGMGTKADAAAARGGASTAVVPLEVDAKGEVRYDALAKQGSNRTKKVFTTLDDVKGKGGDSESQKKPSEEDALALPSEEAEREAASRTQRALGAILDGKINAAKPTHVPEACDGAIAKRATFVRYTPNPNAPGFSEQARQRIVKVVEQQVDPMEPPKHRHSKIPRGPPSPPAPVLHSPPRKVTVQDQQSWKIPPCVSHWKNARGYTIPLDKRLAADGRGLQDQTVNNNFATLAEALYIAERSARDEVRARAQIRQTHALREKEAQEARLRDLAAQARAERSNAASKADRGSNAGRAPPLRDDAAAEAASFQGEDRAAGGGGGHYGRRADEDDDDVGHGLSAPRRGDDDEEDEEDEAVRRGRIEREETRIERKRERERQMRLDNAKGDMKRSRLERERERDVSEKVALGLLKGSAKLTGDAQFDKRLFNQSSGLDHGYGQDDDYNVYSKPLLDREEAAAIYRPRESNQSKYGDADQQYKDLTTKSKFVAPDRAFAGTEGGASAAPRDGPVQFERDAHRHQPRGDDNEPQEQDPFGLDQFLTDVKNAKEGPRRT